MNKNKIILLPTLLLSIILVYSTYGEAQSTESLPQTKSENGRWGLIDHSGKFILEPKYEEIRLFSNWIDNGRVWIKTNNKWGLFDLKGKIIVPPTYDNVSSIQANYDYAEITLAGNHGLITQTGKILVELQYSSLRVFDDGMIEVRTHDGKRGFINQQGKIIAAPVYDLVLDYQNHIKRVQKNQRWGLIKDDGRIIVPTLYSAISEPVDNVSRVNMSGKCDWEGYCEGGKWGLIDVKGTTILEPKYNYIDDFHDGLATVVINGKWGYLNTRGNLAIAAKFDAANDFDNGHASVTYRDEAGYIDRSGTFVRSFNENHYVGSIDNRIGFYMYLTMKAGAVSGRYFYLNQKRPITVQGKINPDGSFDLEEKYEGKISGKFQGTFSAAFDKAGGEWFAPKGKKKLPFILQQVSRFTGMNTFRNVHGFLYFYLENPELQKTVNAMLSKITKGTSRFLIQSKNDLDNMGWLLGTEEESSINSSEYNADYKSNTLISIHYTDYMEGGAHPNTAYASLNLRFNNGRVYDISLDDLFRQDANYLQVIMGYCASNLKEQGASDAIVGHIPALSEKLDVFNIESSGIKFSFAPYQVGSYAEGSYFVLVPYNVLKGLIRLDGPLKDVIK